MDECDFCGVEITKAQNGTCDDCAREERVILIEVTLRK